MNILTLSWYSFMLSNSVSFGASTLGIVDFDEVDVNPTDNISSGNNRKFFFLTFLSILREAKSISDYHSVTSRDELIQRSILRETSFPRVELCRLRP